MRLARLGTMKLVTELVEPTATVHSSFLAAMDELRAEGRGGSDDRSMVGGEIRDFSSAWDSPEGFERYLGWLRRQASPDTPRQPGFVPSTTLWWVDRTDYLGRIAIRHELTDFLLEAGGHIGYDVRPSARRNGHATAMLGATLPIVRDLGIDPVLITCDHDNVASRKVIEANGGVFEDRRGLKLRYWVPTG